MSLKIFHLVFITLSTLVCVGFGVWAIKSHYQGTGGVEYLVLGIISLVSGLFLFYYGNRFFKKIRSTNFLCLP